MSLPIVWLPEADAELQEARAWYFDIRPELGERFAGAVDATVEAIAEHPVQFSVIYRGGGALVYGVFPTESSLKFKNTESW